MAQGLADEAVALLERLLAAAEDGKRMASVIEILALLALGLDAQGEVLGALKLLERALKLAEPEGFVQTFVDEGPPMARLLYDAVSQGMAQDFVQRLLGAFPIDAADQTESISQIAVAEMVEPLSKRESEVLQLIAEGLTNQEIASQLYITLNTVKGHTRNIFAKLGVKNRTMAVAKGKVLGILPNP
jgi:LuxR family maltose regulon positive regulatory protein